MAAATPLYRALVRRKIQFFRWQRSRNNPTNQQQQKRSQSSHNHNSNSNSSSSSNSNKPGHAREEDPVPVPSTVAALPLWQRLGPLTRAAQAYARSQRKRPYVTQVCTSLVIYLCADISAQRMNGKGYDPHRTVRSLIIGGLSSIPSYKWFVYLSHNFNYSSRILSLLVKIGINQACFTPLFNTYFFAMQALLVGDTLPEVWDRVRRTVPVSVVNSLKLWPAVTAFSFTFIPLEYRSVFAGTIAVGWQTYLAYLNRQAEEEEAREKMAHLSSHAQAQAQAHAQDQAHQALPETISDKIPKKATA